MVARLLHIAISLAAVFSAFGLYAACAVPLIEPQASRPEARLPPPGGLPPPKPVEPDEQMEFWFPNPRSWERQSPLRLQNQRGILLFKKYDTLEGGKIRIRPCSLVFLPKEKGPESYKEAAVLQAPRGAILQFDEDFDIRRGSVGKLEGGLLLGDIKIRSAGKSPGPEDDLLITTYDVELSHETISTPHEVHFQWGPNVGHGRGMKMELAVDERVSGELGGLKQFSLLNDVLLDLVLDDEFEMAPAAAERARTAAPGGTPVKVRCRGAFRFDFEKHVATFNKQVDVMRMPEGDADQLICEWMALHFTPRQQPGDEPGATPDGMGKLDASRLEARGNPVVLKAPSSSAYARGEYLMYDIQTGLASLESSGPEVVFRQEDNEVQAQQLHYQPGPDGRVGRFLADGAGWLNWAIADRDDGGQPRAAPRRFEARWNKRLFSRPYEGRQVISLEGMAKAEVTGMGELQADEIHAWLIEKLPEAAVVPMPQPAAGGPVRRRRSELIPDRMLAQGSVRVDSPQLSGRMQKLQAWFETVPAARPADARPAPLPAAPLPGRALPGGPPRPPGGNLVGRGGPAPLAPPRGPARAPSPQSATPRQKFDASGDEVRVQLLLRDKKPELSELVIDGSARLNESRTPQPGDLPLRVRGQLVHAVQQQPGAAVVAVRGGPAHVEGRGLGLTGEVINLDQGANRVWIDGEGLLTLLADRDFEGNPVQNPRPVEITWRGRMLFDGRRAIFEREITARRQHEWLKTETLEVTFDQRVDFANPRQSQRPDIQRIVCREGVHLRRHRFDERGLSGIEQMQAADLAVNQQTGAVVANGPGWVKRVGRGGGEQLGIPGAGGPRPMNPAAAGGDKDYQLRYLFVEFQRAMNGNSFQRRMVFSDHVQTTYGPVDDWEDTIDPDRREQLGSNGGVMTSDELVVTQRQGPGHEAWAELQALGNVLVESQQYTARASRLTYDQEKELLTLEGTDGTSAKLWRQPRPSAKKSYFEARKILYWRLTNHVVVNDARFLDVNDLPRGGSARSEGFQPPKR